MKRACSKTITVELFYFISNINFYLPKNINQKQAYKLNFYLALLCFICFTIFPLLTIMPARLLCQY